MSIGGTLRTSVSGMNVQATRLSVVAENIANADTHGYKRSETEFSTLVLPQTTGGYNSGAVEAQVRSFISQQGGLSYTGNSTNSKKLDLAIKGNGFMVVGDSAGGNYLTRAGSFTQQPDGSLVNAAGYTLKGYPISPDGKTNFTLNGYSGLEDVNLSAALLNANPTTSGVLTTQLDKAEAAINKATAGVTTPSEVVKTTTVAGVTTPGTPADTKVTYSAASSLVVYDNSGQAVKLDIYYTKVGDNQWEMDVFNAADASPSNGTGASTTSPFPYGGSTGVSKGALAHHTLVFNDSTAGDDAYKLKSIDGTAVNLDKHDGLLGIDLTGAEGRNIQLDITNFTQYTDEYKTLAARVDGNPAEVIDSISTSDDGTITATFTSGTTRDLFRVPLALVNSPDQLAAVAGNAYSAGIESGTILMGFGGSGGFGNLVSGALEDSNVDLATELTTMIESQRSYTANSKVFQTGSEILDVLVNLKR